MAIRIIRTQRNGRDARLVVNDDGTVTHHVENFGWRLKRDGAGRRTRTMSANEAKCAWPHYARAIDTAVAKADRRRTNDMHAAPIRMVWQERLARLRIWSSRQRRDARAT
jgi:YD repeat-containing protein